MDVSKAEGWLIFFSFEFVTFGALGAGVSSGQIIFLTHGM
jgi:hypothetical protein